MGYTKDTMRGVGWVGGLRLITRIVSFARIAILARLLSPVQFGVFGIAMLVTALLEVLTETGINVILVQEKNDIKEYVDSAWIVSIIRGIIISIVIFFSAAFVSGFFRSPDSIFLIQLISIIPLIRGFINPSSVKFQKNLEFYKEFWYRFVIFSFDAVVAIVFAYITKSAISLVFGLLAGVIIEVILSFLVVKPIPHLYFNKEYISRIFHRGKWITLSGIFNYLYHNADNIVVGRILGTSSLGLYEMAYKISMLPITEISDVVSKVTFPVYSKIAEDIRRLKKAFLTTLLYISISSILFGLTLLIFTEQIVRIVLGSQWISIVPVLKILVIFGIIRAISGSTSTLFLAVQRQEYITVVTLVSIGTLAITIVPLVVNLGLIGAGLPALLGSVFSLPFMIYFTLKVFSKDYHESA